MKAAVLEEVGKLVIKEVEFPRVDTRGLLVKVESCAICGTDVKVYHYGHRLIHPPRITGHEVAGTIVEVGKEVKGYKVGDRVAVAPAVPCGQCYYCRRGIQSMCDNLTAIGYHYDGGFAEYMAVPPRAVENACVNFIPANITPDEAALAEPLACALNGQELSGVKLGNVVMIIGAGPMGCLHADLAKVNGATKVIISEISPARLGLSKISQADIFINSQEEDPIKRVMVETEGRGADVVIVACSSGLAQEQALQMVAKRGNVNFFGGLPKDHSIIRFDSNLLHYREFAVVGTHGSAPRHNRLALDLIGSGKINAKKYITHRLRLEKLLEGLAMVERGEGLKIIIKPTHKE